MPLPHLRVCAGGNLAGGVPCTSPFCLLLGRLGFVAHPTDGEYNGGRLTLLWTSLLGCPSEYLPIVPHAASSCFVQENKGTVWSLTYITSFVTKPE